MKTSVYYKIIALLRHIFEREVLLYYLPCIFFSFYNNIRNNRSNETPLFTFVACYSLIIMHYLEQHRFRER